MSSLLSLSHPLFEVKTSPTVFQRSRVFAYTSSCPSRCCRTLSAFLRSAGCSRKNQKRTGNLFLCISKPCSCETNRSG